jgi:hypothetical protein
MAVSRAAVESILGLRDVALAGAPAITPEAATEVRILLQTFIAHHVRRQLKSPALLREILGI